MSDFVRYVIIAIAAVVLLYALVVMVARTWYDEKRKHIKRTIDEIEKEK